MCRKQWSSPETNSSTLRPARSMVTAAISTDNSLTAPTMAASSSGSCREEGTRAEGYWPAAPGPPILPWRCRGLRSQLLGALSRQAPTMCQALSLRPSLRAFWAEAQLQCPPLSPEPIQNIGVTRTGFLSLSFKSHLPEPRTGQRNDATIISTLQEEAEVWRGSNFPQ